MKIVLLDKEDFSYTDLTKPLGGAQLAFIELVKSFLAIDVQVEVRNYTRIEFIEGNLSWKKLVPNEQLEGDFFIVNRAVKLLELVPKNARVFLWLHNRAGYLHRWANFKLLIKHRPILVFSGLFHRNTFLFHFLFKSKVIHYGRSKALVEEKPVSVLPEKPIAIFTSNPLRSLDWLVDRWKEIVPQISGAELHIYSGSQTYGSWGETMANKMQVPLDYAKANSNFGIFVHEPLPKKELIKKIKGARVMLYKGDRAETFCLSIDEALALGVPAVTMNLGSMKERITNNEFGFVCETNEEFVKKSIEVLSKDETWQRLNHEIILKKNKRLCWDDVANEFLKEDV